MSNNQVFQRIEHLEEHTRTLYFTLEQIKVENMILQEENRQLVLENQKLTSRMTNTIEQLNKSRIRNQTLSKRLNKKPTVATRQKSKKLYSLAM